MGKSAAASKRRWSRPVLYSLYGLAGLAVGLVIGSLVTLNARPDNAKSSSSSVTGIHIIGHKTVDGQRGYFKAGEGRKFVIVDVDINNATNKSIQLAPATQSYVVGSDGTRYGLAFYTHKQPLKAGSLAPGESRGGQLAYSIPADIDEVTFHFLGANQTMTLK